MKMNFKQNSVKLAIAAGLLSGSVGFTLPAFAATTTSNLAVKASIGNACVVSTEELNFGTYNPNANQDLAGTGKIKTTCTAGATGTIKIGKGVNAVSDSTDNAPVRRMVHGSNAAKFLSYDVFTDSNGTVQWNHTTEGDAALSGTGSEATAIVYGKIAKNQTTAIAGDYTDTLVVTINY